MLAGDDFGYFESVLLTFQQHHVVVSDWLNPFSVGLTIPATAVTAVMGDIWLGSLLTVGLFGLLGAWALRRLVLELGIRPALATRAMLLWSLMPIWLAKWARFESAVPATSLMIVGLWLLLRGTRRAESWTGPFWLLGGSGAIAWAIAIRQNHIVLVGIGAILVIHSSPLRRRYMLLASWAVLPVVVFVGLQFALPKTFATEHMLIWRLSQLTVDAYLANLGRGLAFSAGSAALLLALTSPHATWRVFRQSSAQSRSLGLATLLACATRAILNRHGLEGFTPTTDILLLEKFWPLTAAVTLVGAAVWPLFFHSSAGSPKLVAIIGFGACSYVALSAVWGGWEYYYVESTLLLWCAGILVTQPSEIMAGRLWHRRVLTGIAVCTAAAVWYAERISIDQQAARLDVFEQAFRSRLITPAEAAGMPFGLAGWNLFPAHALHWRQAPAGNPLGFWVGRSSRCTVYFRWRSPLKGRLQPNDTVLRHGRARVGGWTTEWTLFRQSKREDPSVDKGGQHRFLPLSRKEWRQFIKPDTVRSGPRIPTETGT